MRNVVELLAVDFDFHLHGRGRGVGGMKTELDATCIFVVFAQTVEIFVGVKIWFYCNILCSRQTRRDVVGQSGKVDAQKASQINVSPAQAE